MPNMFAYSSFNQSIGKWITAAVTSMNSMFYAAKAFNQDIGNWDTAAVTDMRLMFVGAIAFNQNLCWDITGKERDNTLFAGTGCSGGSCWGTKTLDNCGPPTAQPTAQPTSLL